MEQHIPMIERPGGERLAYHYCPPAADDKPTIIFFPGYMSDMYGGKATELAQYAKEVGRGMLRFDYAGCGQSEGNFEAQSLIDWRDDAVFLIDKFTNGPLILVGSSMGGWLMLLTALQRPDRVAALIGIASAPDFTDWGVNEAERQQMREMGIIRRPNAYDDEDQIISKIFYDSGQANRLLQNEIAINVPVRLLHGELDDAVPWEISLQIMTRLRSANVQLNIVKGGDHRLSREEDIETLKQIADTILPA